VLSPTSLRTEMSRRSTLGGAAATLVLATVPAPAIAKRMDLLVVLIGHMGTSLEVLHLISLEL
jgi:hypothetical protein